MCGARSAHPSKPSRCGAPAIERDDTGSSPAPGHADHPAGRRENAPRGAEALSGTEPTRQGYRTINSATERQAAGRTR